jgi:hypothetical protein
MTLNAAPFPEKLSKYLQLGNHEIARREALLLWEEAVSLLRIGRWRGLLGIDEFHAVFHPYAQLSHAVQSLLQNAHSVWLFAATIGDGLERRSRQYLAQRETFRGYILDRMGSFLIEEEIRRMDDLTVEECAKNGLETTRRYSPGYRDFSLEAQSVFVKLASGAIPELRLTSDFLLLPEKSITAVKGVRGAPQGSAPRCGTVS